ncbi:hypothetical protein KBD45_06925 [Candidatus Dojkabacteria bacterium]|nr:hypothetical protein [Candidatus Dojkabacteria bacterium]
MSNNSDNAEVIGYLILGAIVIAAILLLMYIAFWIVSVLFGVGAATGAGHALYNYQRAFTANVNREV